MDQHVIVDNGEDGDQNGESIHEWTLSLHTFSDLRSTSPVTFMYLLKECYAYGTLKATAKFRSLQQQLKRDLLNSPKPGPFTYIMHCLYIIPLFWNDDAKGFSHMLVSCLKHFKILENIRTDYLDAKQLATQLVLDLLAEVVSYDELIMVKLIEIFEIELNDIAQAMYGPAVQDDALDKAKAHLEHYIHAFVEKKSYTTAVNLIVQYSIQCCDEAFLVELIDNNQHEVAQKWAKFMGKRMVRLLIQKYIDMKKLKAAYDMVKQCNLSEEFPTISYQYKESQLKKFAEQGLWELAEMRAKQDKKLIEFLVYLAMEAGYTEMVDELCMRYSLHGFVNSLVPKESSGKADYMDLDKLVLEDIVWVDDVSGLECATQYIEGCKIVGVDCEWKPNYIKGSKPNKVSIMQIASDKRAFIFDLIKLCKEEPDYVNSCFSRIMCSSNILKLGYNLSCDLSQLSQSYGDLNCFKSYEMLLDLQKLFAAKNGGLSGLSERVLGVGLNKTRRNSDWEQRPLSLQQKEYAALDAAVLVRIFHHVRDQPHLGINKETNEWKSHIIRHFSTASSAVRLQK